MRVTRDDRHLPKVVRGPEVDVLLDGRKVSAHDGETVAAVLLAEGIRVFRRNRSGHARGLYCGMGICYECLVTVDGETVRACVTPVTGGIVIETGGLT
jgi:predicted molibdopterin-dependent oxidoreductase YjgC